MKPYDKSNSFMRRVTKRVSELIPGTTWMNMLLGDSQTGDDPPSATEHDDQPPVKKLCTSNNTFTNVNNRTRVDTSPLVNSDDNHRNSNMNVLLPEISASTCLPSTSKQSPKFLSQSNSSVCHDIGNRSSLKRKSDAVDVSNINRLSQKGVAFNFASSTPTLSSVNQQPMVLYSRESESQSLLKFRETTTKPHVPSPSFRWDTFVNYGELSERQKLFAQKSPLNCSQVMYGGNSARSNLSKILGNSPAIHIKSTIPISPTKNSEIRTTSSILLSHISTKDKEIEENKFIIQPRMNLRHKAEQKMVPIKVETTVNNVDTTPEKTDDKLNNISSICTDRDSSRKLKVNISKKGRGLLSEEFEMPAKVDLPNISLPLPVLPCINLSNTNLEDNEFTFNQPLTLEQFSLQVAAKSCKKKQKTILKKIENANSNSNNENQHLNPMVSSSPLSVTTNEVPSKETVKENSSISNNNIKDLISNNKTIETSQFGDFSKNTFPKSIQNPDFKIEPTNVDVFLDNSSQTQKFNDKKQQHSDKLSVELKKWTCNACWVSNDGDKINCVACQASKPDISNKPLIGTKVAGTWTCETCWVPNNKETDACVACQTQKPSGTIKKAVEPNSNWTCDACWVKNKNDCNSCISCGTVKPGSALENKPQSSTQFKFGLNNNSFKDSCAQFKFGFDTNITKSDACPTTESNTSNASTKEFKFGIVNNKSDQPLSSLKFGSDSNESQPIKISNKSLNSNNAETPPNQFKFGFEKKTDQPETQFKFGLNSVLGKPIANFKFGSGNTETEKSAQQNIKIDDNKVAQSTNELKQLVNNGNETSTNLVEVQNSCSPLKFGDTKQTEKSNIQFTFGSIKTNCNDSNTFANNVNKTEDLSKDKFIWDKKNRNETKPINFSMPSTIQSSTGNTYTNQMVNGHSHSNEILNEDQKPALIKSQLFSFGSLAKQDQNVSNDQNKPKTFAFGSVTNDNKSFVTPTLTTSSFPNTGSVFGASNSLFGNGPTTSTSTTLGSSLLKPQFSFGSMAPASDGFFSKTTKDNDKASAQTSNSLNSTPKIGFSFDAQSSPGFSVANNTGLFTKSTIQADNQSKSISSNIFNPSSTKSSVKLDPNAPISINFTGGATTQFTAKPETTEPSEKRKILKPVRRIR